MKTITLPALPFLVGVCAAALLSASGGAVAGSLITGKDIKDNTITTADVRDDSLTFQDLSTKTAKSLRRIGGYQVVLEQLEVSAGSAETVSATCPQGTRVLGMSGYWRDSSVAVQGVIAGDGSGATAYTEGVGADDLLQIRITCGRVV